MGVYTLMDERDIYPMTTGRMDITPHPDPTISEFVLERDRRASRGDVTLYRDYVMVYGVAYDIRFPNGGANRTIENGQYVYNFLSEVSHAIRSGDINRMEEIIDLDAFIDFFIVQELMRNPDSGFSSLFMQIVNQEDGRRRLVKGPLWDFDISAGNNQGARPERLLAARRNYWFYYALQSPEFLERFIVRWDQTGPLLEETLQHIYDLSRSHQADFNSNFERHPIFGVDVWRSHPATLELNSHLEHVDHLIEFLQIRYAYLTNLFHSRNFNIVLGDNDFDPNTYSSNDEQPEL
jgi:hypothetical protein